MKRSHRYTWMLNGWTNSTYLAAEGGGTEFVTIGVPDDFVAVRAGFPNINAAPWTVRKIIACASSCWNDAFNPVADARQPRPASAWSTLTFQNTVLDGASVITAAGAPTEITVAGNAADPSRGETSNPSWTFTDWAPCVSLGTDPATGMRVLMLRALVPGNQVVTFTNGRMTGYSASASVNKGYRYFTGGLKKDTDLVSHPAPDALPGMRTATVDANHLVNGQLICCVQVLTRNAGIVGLVAGDSHQAGTATTSGVNNFLVQSLLEIGRGTIGTLPVGVVSTAAGGLSSRQFFPRMAALLDAVRPAFVVLPGWSYNERDGGVHANAVAEDALFSRMKSAAGQVRAAGALPLFLTPFPRDRASMTPAVLDVWLARRDAVRSMRDAGEWVFDASPLLGAMRDGGLTGTYRDGLSNDTIHPNDTGHGILARALIPELRNIMGLPPSEAVASITEELLAVQAAPEMSDADSLSGFLARLRWHEG